MFIFVKFNKFPRHVFFSGSFNNDHYDIITALAVEERPRLSDFQERQSQLAL